MLSSGECGIIETVRSIHYDEAQTTYNFEVEDFHTYYVGAGVLVHNDCINEELTKIAKKYNDFQCVNCANEMKEFLLSRGITPKQAQIKFSGMGDYNNVWSNSLNRVISYNGYHTGIVYKGVVYDNLFKTGLFYSRWINEFSGFGAIKIF